MLFLHKYIINYSSYFYIKIMYFYIMCGITCVLGEGNTYQHILDSLYQLQNRGYDSAGISIIENGIIKTEKYASNNHKTALEFLINSHYKTHIGIGHTRWATHGPKTDINSHPHHSFDEMFSLVHNGIIENFEELKIFLQENNIYNKSQTDSEVIVNLIAYYYSQGNSIIDSIKNTTCMLKGTWGIAFICINEPNNIYCTRHGSPLLVGVENNLAMITSEYSGFCNLLNKYMALNNNDICILNYDGNIVKMETENVYIERSIKNNKNDLTPYPYTHWTIKEIYEQMDSSLRSMSLGGRLLSNNEVKLGGLEGHEENLCKLENIILLGCGTSYNAGLLGEQYFKEICNFNTVQTIDGSEFSEKDLPRYGKTGLILLSQSGETKDLHRCIDIARSNNLFTIGVINVVDSLIAREVNCGCYLNAGREVAVASTKSFTSQVILLNMISIWFAQKKNINEYKRIQMINDLRSLPYDIEKTLKIHNNIKFMIHMFENSCFILGKEKGYSIACEGALKIKEMSYLHCEGYNTSSLKHGPFAMLHENFPVILIAPNDNFYAKSMNAYEEIKSRYANIVLITDDANCNKDNVLKIPYNYSFRHLLSIIPIQLIAYELSISKNINPDFPRNLAKVVTVE